MFSVLPSTSLAGSNHMKYFGCFERSNRSLDINVSDNITGAVDCVGLCHEQQFNFAGVDSGKYCKCGNGVSGKDSQNCTIKCPSDESNLCGGENLVSVYEIIGHRPSRPMNLRIVSQSSLAIHIAWDAPFTSYDEPLQSYEVIATPDNFLGNRREPPIPKTWTLDKNATSYLLNPLLPATLYSVEVRASNKNGLGKKSEVSGWTVIGSPPTPEQPYMISRTPDTIVVKLHVVSPTNGPITTYRVVVVDETVGVIMNEKALTDFFSANEQKLPYYIAAEFVSSDFKELFTVGDNKSYNGYYNPPLTPNRDHHILLGVTSSVNNVSFASYSQSDHSQHFDHDHPYEVYDDHDHDDEDDKTKIFMVPNDDKSLTNLLYIGIGLIASLLLIGICSFLGVRVYYARKKAFRRSDVQELTANAADFSELSSENVNHYMTEEDLPDHYRSLKQRIPVMAPSGLTFVGDIGDGIFGPIRYEVCSIVSIWK